MWEYKRRMSPMITGLPRRFTPRNDRGMDSRLRGNDKRGNGNERDKNLLFIAPTYSEKPSSEKWLQ